MTNALDYLSDEWHAFVVDAFRGLPATDPPFASHVGYKVLLADGSVSAYRQVFRGGRLDEQVGSLIDGADLTLTLDYETSAAWFRAEIDARAAFFSGRIRTEGDLKALVRISPLTKVAGYDEVRAALLEVTRFAGVTKVAVS